MELTIELTHEEETRLRELAAGRGVPPEEVVTEAVKRLLPLPVDQRNLNLVELLEQWREEDATDDEEELARRDQEWEEHKTNMNKNRAATGERPLFP